MNILHLLSQADSYDAVMGTIDLAKCLARHGHRCIVASSRNLALLAYDTSGVAFEALASKGRGGWQHRQNYYTIRAIIKKNNIEIIHAHSPLMSWLALFAGRAENVPYVSTCHDFYAPGCLHESLVLGKYVIVQHEAMGGYLAEAFGVPPESLRFIRQRIDLDAFEFRAPDTRSKTDFTIALTLPLRPSAGYESFLTGMVKATRIIPNLKILIADNMPQSQCQYKKDLMLFIRGLGLEGHVAFFDASRFDLSVASRCNIVAAPCSRETACTRPLLEAFAYGTPVIASRVAGIAEMIDDTATGILLPVDDHNAFSEAVVQLLRDFVRARTLAFAARRKAQEEHDIGSTIDDFIHVYQQAIQHKRILVINLGTIAETMWSMPALRLLKKQMPDACIANLSRASLRSLFVRCPFVDEATAYDSSRRTKGIVDFMRIARLLRRGRFDVAVDFTNTFSTQFLSYASLAPERYGYRNTILKRLVNRGIQRADAAMLHPCDQRLLMIRPLVGADVKEQTLAFLPSPEEAAFVDRLFEEHWVGAPKVIGVDISSPRSLFTNETWLDSFAYLCDMLAHNDMRVVVVGLDVDAAKKNAFTQRIQSKPILALGDISPRQFISLIERCSLYIGSNRELLQLAMALHIPSLALSAAKKPRQRLFTQHEASAPAVLTKDDIQSVMRTRRRRRYGAAAPQRNIVLDKVNQLINPVRNSEKRTVS